MNLRNPEEIDPQIFELFEFRPRKGDFKKIEIIMATIDCLASEGLEKTTYDAIAKRLGTRRAHVAYHFGDKNEIFTHCIKYIVANYQQSSLEHIKTAKTKREMLFNYIDGPFNWAKDNPQEITVMLLFYYFCCIKNEFLELHQQIRKGGVERIQFILSGVLSEYLQNYSGENKIEQEKLLFLQTPQPLNTMAKDIQNIISGTLLDMRTTKLPTAKDYEDTKEKCKQDIWKMIESTIKN